VRHTSRELPAAESIELGSLVGGRYRVEEKLGAGGTAVIYRVTDTSSATELALKLLQTPSGDAPDSRMRLFEREYLTLCNLAHPRIVTAHVYVVAAEGPSTRWSFSTGVICSSCRHSDGAWLVL
jgi:serine/threonine protein kinase